MARILLLLEHRENNRLLSKWLATRYEVYCPYIVDTHNSAPILEQYFDLCILDGQALDRHWKWVQTKRQGEQPVFLPFLLVTPRQDVGLVTRHLWQSVDELIISPIEKVELQARVEILLRSRQCSQKLKTTNQELQNQIAERQRLETALAQSEAKYRALVQNSSDVITVVSPDGTIEYQCPASQQVLGFAAEELEGKNIFDYVHPEDLKIALAPLRTCLANPEQTQTSQYRFRHKDGSWRYLESKSNFSPSNPSLTGIVVNSRDITARKQAEEETRKALEKAQELHEAKSRFVSMVSHEIRNPLHGILAATQILERYSEKWSTEKKQEFFQRIKIGVRKMTDLLDNVLIMGRAEQRRLEPIPVPINLESFSRNLIEEIKQDTSSKQKIVFEKRCAVNDANQCQCKKAYQDEKLLRHILNNLLSNAIKYSPPNSTIHFSLSCHNDEVIFEIKDEGIGIPPEDQQHLFESFHRATNVNNIPGTGIGLAIVKRCVEVQGGKIAVTSQVGVGSTFTVTLPLLNPVSKNVGAIV